MGGAVRDDARRQGQGAHYLPDAQKAAGHLDQATARGRHDVVLAHLGHPLVDMSARLLRAAVWSGQTGLHRVTAVISDDPGVEHTLAGAYSRFAAVGADGIRLHEEVLYAGGWLRDDGTFRRVEGLGELAGILDHALSQGTPAAPVIQDRLIAQWRRRGHLRAHRLGQAQQMRNA